MATKRIAAPEWLSTRRDENPDRWQGSTALPLIAATLADARSGIVRATTDPSEIGELLRTYALVQARYGIVDLFDEAHVDGNDGVAHVVAEPADGLAG